MRFSIWLFGLLLLAASCKNDIQDPLTVDPTLLDAGVERGYNPDIRYSDSAQMKVRIRGGLILNYVEKSSQRQEFPEGVRVDFYNSAGQLSSVLTARSAVRYQIQGRVIARDSVVWKSMDDEMIETSELTWDERTQKIYTNKFVVITRPQDTIYSQGFEANQDFTDIQLQATDGRIGVEEQ